MGCCDCGCDSKKKRKVPWALVILGALALLAIYFWQ